MNATLVLTSVLHLLLVGVLALLPQPMLVQPGRLLRLGLGALCGLAALLIAAQGAGRPELGLSPLHPVLVAAPALLWGPAAGALAAVVALMGMALVPQADWSAAPLLALACTALGAAWWWARRFFVLPGWVAVAGLTLSLPVLLFLWLPQGSQPLLTWLQPSPTGLPWRYLLGTAVLCGGAELLRARAASLLRLTQREEDLARALRASGGGRWEWDVRAQRLSYGGLLYRDFGLSDSPDDGSGNMAHMQVPSRSCRRWSRERHHPEDLRRLAGYLRRVLDGHEAMVQVEYRMRDNQGRWRWVVARGHAVQRDAHGRVLRLSGMELDVTEQRERDRAQQARQAQYAAIFQTLPDAAGITRLSDGCYLDVNPAFERLLGKPRSQILGRNSLELGVWADQAARKHLVDALARLEEVRGLPVTVHGVDGSVCGHISARRAQIDGEVCMVFVFHDQTQEQRVREELLASNSLLRQAGWIARMGVWEIRPQLEQSYWSDVCYDIHGVPLGQPVTHDYANQFVAPEWREQVFELMRRCVHQALPWQLEMQIIRADGNRLWVRVHGEPVIEAGRVICVRGIMQDIDDLHRSAERLRASEQHLAKMFQLLPAPLGISRSQDGTYLEVNPAWSQLTGFSREQTVGQTSVSLGIVGADDRAELMRLARQGDVNAYEMEITSSSGERRTVLQSVSALRYNDEDCWLFTLQDITKRKQAEQRVREREELLSLSISAASLGLWDWDLQKGTLTGDQRWHDLLGLPPAPDAHGHPWINTLGRCDPDAVSLELTRHLTEPWLPFDVTAEACHPERSGRWVRNLGKVIAWGEDGEPQRLLGMSIDVTSQRNHAQQLERMALYDALTSLPNRVLLHRLLQQAMRQSQLQARPLGVGYLDLDGFKPVNDKLGHAMGDRLLVQVAQRLQQALRPGDSVARLGGDEFVILLPSLADQHECEQRLQAIMHSVSAPYPLAGEQAVVTASIGYTLYPDDQADADTLLRHADQAMYAAKQAGRNRFHAFDAQSERAQEAQREQCMRLMLALEQGELALYLQPKVDMRSGAVVGAEALARWEHPQRGVLAPVHFLPLLDGHDELQALFGEWVVDSALTLIDQLMHQGLHIPLSINITPEHLQRPGFAPWLLSRLALHPRLPARLLQLELTESAALHDFDHAARELSQLRSHGVGIAFDDFGTGYSSLSYLRRLPMDCLKLDRSFVAGMLHDPGDRAIVRGVIGLGRSFGCDTVAEGVETMEQGRALLQMGCFLAQGYGIARPMPAGQFAAWARGWRAPAQWLAAVPAPSVPT
ncbi:hypothetical protein MASR1M59_17370 [Melaminivora sp.]